MDGSSSALSSAVTAKSRRNSEIVRLRRGGVGPREIARRLDLSAGAVAGALHRAGLCKAPMGRGFGASAEMVREVLAWVAVIGPVAAARRFGVHRSTINNWRLQRAAEASEPQPRDQQVPDRRSRETIS